MSLYFLYISHITSIPNAKALLPHRTGRFSQYTAENYSVKSSKEDHPRDLTAQGSNEQAWEKGEGMSPPSPAKKEEYSHDTSEA